MAPEIAPAAGGGSSASTIPGAKCELARSFGSQRLIQWRSGAPSDTALKGAAEQKSTPEIAARRYLQASEFGTDASGQFFASPPKKLTGPIEAMRHPHFHDRANQEAAWQAVVRVSGVDLSYPASSSTGS